MSEFTAAWLALREPHDAAARSAALLERLPARRARHIVDLAAGTGANLRYLAPRLGPSQRWLLVDHDADLLAAVEPALRAWAAAQGAALQSSGAEIAVSGRGFDCSIALENVDLAADLRALALPPGALVTCSALLDLVSETWLRELAGLCRGASADVAFALTYDGRMSPGPPDPWDRRALELFNRHQRGDKGFGPALGPGAAEATVRIFDEHGYALAAESSDWRLGPGAVDLQGALLDGWLHAAVETEPSWEAELAGWRARRGEHLRNGRATLTVGHRDVVGWIAR